MKKICMLGLLSLSLASAPAFAQGGDTDRPVTGEDPETYITHLMQKMTLDEKIGQLRLVSADAGPDAHKDGLIRDIEAGKAGGIFNTAIRPDIRVLQDAAVRSRLKIPLFFAYDVLHGHRTIFPIGLGLASTWDMDAVAQSGRISAVEASADGLNMTFSPMVDISRDPRWGRTSEGFGEDTFLVSRISATLVNAYQGSDPAAPGNILAAVKHFAAYRAIEAGHDYKKVDMSPQRLFQDDLPPFKEAIDAGAAGVITPPTAVNGVPANANKWLLQDILRKQWGFQGVTISDHGAIIDGIKHGVAGDGADASRLAISAGVDMSMSDSIDGRNLKPLLQAGRIKQADIDRAVRDVLRIKYNLGLFQNPYRHVGVAADDPPDPSAESRMHRQAAREVAQQSLVLLKNDKQTLPLKKQGSIAVIGALAKSQRDMMGGWSAAGMPGQVVTLYQGLTEAVGDKATLLYAHGANTVDDPEIIKYLNLYEKDVEVDPRTRQQLIDEAVETAKKADVVVAVVGETQGMAHEASRRSDIDLPGGQEEMLKALKATGKPLVVVLMNGRPLALGWEKDNADAMLETWFAGTEGGHAVADVLFGDVNPSAKLPMTFPRSVGQIPIYYNHLNTGRPFDPQHPDKHASNNFDAPNGPLFPFGYGLSYTTFDVSDIKLSATSVPMGNIVRASVTVRNTGTRDGATVVQLYLQDPVASISRPVKELKGFEKIMLKAGEQKEVTFPIQQDDLSFYNKHLKRVVEPGRFNVYIGLDSQDVKAASFKVMAAENR